MHSIGDQVFALAGITQAAVLASQIAHEGQGDPVAMAGTIHSVLMLDADNCESIFIDIQHIRLGLQTLCNMFESDSMSNKSEILSYSVNMLQLQNMLARREDLLKIISDRLLQIQKQADIAGSEIHSSVIASIASLYVDTVSTFRLRIQVRGNPVILQKDVVAEQIRAVLLGGIRAAMLWRQMGGSRLDIFFKRKAICSTAHQMLKTYKDAES